MRIKRNYNNVWRRFAMSANAHVSVVSAAALAVMLIFLAQRYYIRLNVGSGGDRFLSSYTETALAGLGSDVKAIVLFRPGSELAGAVNSLLREYEHASPRVRVERLDPDRDLARVAEVARVYELSEADVVVFDGPAGRKILRASDLADYDYIPMLRGLPKRISGFKGESLFTSSLLEVASTNKPVVYFLQGHGESGPENYDERTGYSMLGRQLRLNNIYPRSLTLGETNAKIPADCAALVIAGPTRPIPSVELDSIMSWLERGGRLMVLADFGAGPGLTSFLRAWGVRLGPGIAESGMLGRAGYMPVRKYGAHPITRGLENITTVFVNPISVIPDAGAWDEAAGQKTDKPNVAVLAFCQMRGAAATNTPGMVLEQGLPPVSGGLAPVAVVVERGDAQGLKLELALARMVVIGDAAMAANGALRMGHTTDLFLSALDWLLQRESPPRIPVAEPARFVCRIAPEHGGVFFIGAVFAPSAIVCLLGLAVLIRRRI